MKRYLWVVSLLLILIGTNVWADGMSGGGGSGTGDMAKTTYDTDSNNVVDTATALAANPTDCSAGEFATTIAANGNLTCSAVVQMTAAAVAALPDGTIAAGDTFPGRTAAGTLTEFTWPTNLASLAGLTFADASIIQLTGPGASAVLTSGGANRLLGSNSDNSAIEFKTSITGVTVGGFTASAGMVPLTDASGNLVNSYLFFTGPTTNAKTKTVSDASATIVEIDQTLVTRTEFIPVAWMIDGAAAPDALATVDLGTRQVKARTFAADSSEDVEMFWQAPIDIVDGDGGTAGFQVKWRPIYVITHATAPASGEGVVFALSSCSSGDSDSGNCTVGDDSVVAYADLDGHAQYDVVYGTYTAMTVTAGAAGEGWMMKLYRDHDHASDDYGQVVGLIGIEIKYQTKLTNGY